MKTNKNRGSALVLVMIALLILSLIGLAALTQTSSEINTAGNFYKDKSTFFAADAGINYGIAEISKSLYPPEIKFTQTIGKSTYKSGGIFTSEEPVKPFTGFPAPAPQGMSVEMCTELGISTALWQLTVSAEEKSPSIKVGSARKEISAIINTFMSEY